MKIHAARKFSLITGISYSAVFVALTACAPQALPSPEPITEQAVHRAVASLTPRASQLLQATGVPGMAIAVVYRDKVIFSKGFGVRTVGTNEQVNADTVFQLASMAKPISSTVVAGVVGEGRVKWDDPIVNYIPGFTLSNKQVSAEVTIADMFAHRSGLPGHAGDALGVLLGCQRMEVIDRLKFEPLGPFRTQYDYSNFGLTTGAQAAANAAGLPWELLSKRVLYDPLGMNSTSSTWSDYRARANRADIHFKTKQGQWIVSTLNDDAASPAGGTSSSVNDLAKWMMLELNGGSFHHRPVINKTALLATHQPQITIQAASATKTATYYGLGMNVNTDSTQRLRLGHSGAFPQGAATTVEMLPSEQLGIVVLTNGTPIGLPETIAQEFFDLVEYGSVQRDWYGELSKLFKANFSYDGKLENIAPPTPPISAPSDTELLGKYQNPFYGTVAIERSSTGLQLVLKPCETQTTFALTHWSANTFAFPFGTPPAAPTSALDFTPANGNQAAMITIEYLNASGLGTFSKVP